MILDFITQLFKAAVISAIHNDPWRPRDVAAIDLINWHIWSELTK